MRRAAPRAMSSGSGAASAPTLSRPIGGLAGGKDNAGLQDAEGVEALLEPAEERHDLLAVDPPEQARRGAARRHARPTGVPPSRTSADVTSSSSAATARLPARPADLGQQVHVHVTVAGVAEHHRRRCREPRQPARTARMYSPDPLHRHAAILDHLERSPVLRQPGQDRARGVAQRPEPVGRGRAERRLHRTRPTAAPPRRRRPPPRGQLAGILALQLDQQHGLGLGPARRPHGPAHQLEEGAVEQLDGRRPARRAARRPPSPGRRATAARPGAPARWAGIGSSRHSDRRRRSPACLRRR